MIVGFLERLGIRLDWALNSLSTISFFLLCFTIYLLGRVVFESKGVGVISVLLFLFNGSLGFLEFFKKNPLSPNTFLDIISNKEFSSFGPYDGKIVSAFWSLNTFWSLNIYTNQRHLAFAYASFLSLLLIFFLFSKNTKKLSWTKSLLIGIFIGFFPFIHLAVFLTMGTALITFFLIYPKLRPKILVIGIIALIIALPQYLYMGNRNYRFDYCSPTVPLYGSPGN